MIRINLPWIIEVMDALNRLDTIKPGERLVRFSHCLFDAEYQLESLFDRSIYRPFLRISRQQALDLHHFIQQLLRESRGDSERMLTDVEVWSFKNRRDRFKTAFLAEMSTLPSYLVTNKESYDVNLLIESGVGLFPPNLLSKAPETENDAMEVGKALAFEVPTACAFHVFRVLDAVVRRYWDEVSMGMERPKNATLGNFAVEMEKQGTGDQRVIESLKQVAKLQRNYMLHTEAVMTIEDAIGVIGIARSIIGVMLHILPDTQLSISAPMPTAA